MDQKQPSAGGWQPIETAPRDGTPVIVARHMDEFGWIRGWARWAGGDGFVSGWVSYGFDPVMGELGLAHPTHWQPLPAPPAAAAEQSTAPAPAAAPAEPIEHASHLMKLVRAAWEGDRPTREAWLAYAAAREAADPAKRAEWVYGQPMQPCPKCGSYNMKPQMPIKMDLTGDETVRQVLGKWARATKGGATPLEGPCYYVCWDCKHHGPAVDCTGRTSEDARQDRALNAEMKRLWNAQERAEQHHG